MPLIAIVVLVIQLCFAYHAIKTGRPYYWVAIIMAAPTNRVFNIFMPTSRDSSCPDQTNTQSASFIPSPERGFHLAARFHRDVLRVIFDVIPFQRGAGRNVALELDVVRKPERQQPFIERAFRRRLR